MPQTLHIKEFLKIPGARLDVRSPGEFFQGHIPRSHSFPLFTDQERAQIGTVYKKQSKQEAIELGLTLLEPKLDLLLNSIQPLLDSKGTILCWRGGMRSGFAARLLELFGYEISILQGGYKAYRHSVLKQLDEISLPTLQVLGGLTGSGKTAILHTLRVKGEQVIDLEELVKHRGSVFGGIGCEPQPTQEQFENNLALEIERLDRSLPIWIEDESRLIGRCYLPQSLYQEILRAPLFFIQRPLSERLEILLNHYGRSETEQLLSALAKIEKRLGSQLTREIKILFQENLKEQAFEKLLVYYDKTYQHQIEKRQMIHQMEGTPFQSDDEWANFVLSINL